MEYYIPPNKELYYSVDEKKVYLTRKGVNNWVELPKILFEKVVFNKELKNFSVEYIGDNFIFEDEKKIYYKYIEILKLHGMLDLHKKNGDKICKGNYNLEKLVIQITNRCNLMCDYCCMDSSSNNIEEEDFINTDIIKKIKILNPKQIVISGGEPLVKDNLFEICECIKNEFNTKLSLSTNGTLIDKFNSKKIVNYFDGIDISLDGYNDNTCSQIRGKGVYESVIRGINLLREEKCIPISLSTVIGKFNRESEQKFIDLCKKIDVNPNIKQFMSLGRGNNVKKKYLDNDLDIIYYDDVDLINQIYEYKAINCMAGYNQVFIDNKGDLFPCPLLAKEEYKFGNITSISNEKIIETFVNKKHEIFDRLEALMITNQKKCKKCNRSIFCFNCIAIVDKLRENEEVFEHNCNKMKLIFGIE